jgi:hypothetical protein
MTTQWKQSLDPREELEFVMDFGGGAKPLLAPNEKIATFDVSVADSAAEAGLTILEDGDHAAKLSDDGRAIENIWLAVDELKRDDPRFRRGLRLDVCAVIVTDSDPPRTRKRTFRVRVRQL